MTSSVTSGRHLLMLKKADENAASYGFGSNFSGAAFCLPHQLVGILLSYLAGSKSVSAHPFDPGDDDNCHSRHYCFVERQNEINMQDSHLESKHC